MKRGQNDTLTIRARLRRLGFDVVAFTLNGIFYMLNKLLTPLKLVHGMPILHFMAQD